MKRLGKDSIKLRRAIAICLSYCAVGVIVCLLARQCAVFLAWKDSPLLGTWTGGSDDESITINFDANGTCKVKTGKVAEQIGFPSLTGAYIIDGEYILVNRGEGSDGVVYRFIFKRNELILPIGAGEAMQLRQHKKSIWTFLFQ